MNDEEEFKKEGCQTPPSVSDRDAEKNLLSFAHSIAIPKESPSGQLGVLSIVDEEAQTSKQSNSHSPAFKTVSQGKSPDNVKRLSSNNISAFGARVNTV